MAKGGEYERSVAKRLSLWWTSDKMVSSDGPRDDVFWRTDGSGARAKVRSKQGKRTVNSCGDIGCIDPIGLSLLKVVTIECKKGYPRACPMHFVDRLGKQLYAEWIEKAQNDADSAGSLSWAIIHRRDYHEELLWGPPLLFTTLRLSEIVPSVSVVFSLDNLESYCITGVRFADFVASVRPLDIVAIARDSATGTFGMKP